MKTTAAMTFLILSLGGAAASATVTFDWATVGNPGNAADTEVDIYTGTTGYGSVAYVYRISKHEVTNAHYTEFLNAVAATDTNSLYHIRMGSGEGGSPRGGIVRSGSSGSYTYAVKPDSVGNGPGGADGDDYAYADKPVTYVSVFDAMRFVNWLENGQPTGVQGLGTTEDGVYTISDGFSETRAASAAYFIPSEDEWYKAAYHDASAGTAGTYFDYPTSTNTVPNNNLPSADTGNSANFDHASNTPYPFTDVGAYTLSASPYGTFDQGGNAYEWSEDGHRGGSFSEGPVTLSASLRGGFDPSFQTNGIGFRVGSSIPQPSTALLGALASIGLLLLRRRCGGHTSAGKPLPNLPRRHQLRRGGSSFVKHSTGCSLGPKSSTPTSPYSRYGIKQINKVDIKRNRHSFSSFCELIKPREDALRKTTAALALLTLTLLYAPAALADTFGSGANQFDIEFVPIGNPDNPGDITGSPNPAGKVEYAYRLGKFEISEDMIDKANAEGGLGITHDNRGVNKPATSVSWFEAATFVNWLNTSHGRQAAYNFDGSGIFQLWSSGESWQAGGENRFRHKEAFYFLPSVDEWYKAAYYDPTAGVYYNYPTGSDSVPDGIDFAGDTMFDAVFFDGGANAQPNDITDVGVLSPYGTAGQGGNVWEWEETEIDLVNDSGSSARGVRGGRWNIFHNQLLSSDRFFDEDPAAESSLIGFRVASIPETSFIAGDLDENGVVDGADFLFWQRGDSMDPLSASDLADWEANFGTVPLATGSTAVPEPGTLICGLISVLAGCGCQCTQRLVKHRGKILASAIAR